MTSPASVILRVRSFSPTGDVSTEGLKLLPLLQQMQEIMLCPTLHVRVANLGIQSSDLPKLCCAL